MPVCVGIPETGRWPNDVDDDQVNCRNVCELFLCKECYEYRVPVLSVKSARAEAALSKKSMAVEVISSYPSFEVN